MFNFIDKGKMLALFDTDRITKIGEATQDPPIACHLFVKDTQLFTAQSDTDPIFVYGELYTSIDVPTISSNVKVEKMNPNTGEVIASYEGTPSRPIVGQSRKKYSVRFFDAVTPDYPKIVNVSFWDSVNKAWVDGVGLTIELLDDKTANPKDGFEKAENEFSEEVNKITGTDILLNTYPYFKPYIFKDKDAEIYYSFEDATYGADYEWDYVLTENPEPPVTEEQTEFGVYYWRNNEWYDTQGTIEIGLTGTTFMFTSGFKDGQDEWGDKAVIIENGNVMLDSFSYFYLKEKGGTERILKCKFTSGSIGINYNVPFTLVDEPGA